MLSQKSANSARESKKLYSQILKDPSKKNNSTILPKPSTTLSKQPSTLKSPKAVISKDPIVETKADTKIETKAANDDINQKTPILGYTDCMRAAANNRLDDLKRLVDDKADINCLNIAGDGRAAIHIAVKLGHIDIVRYLIETGKADINLPTKKGETPCILTIFYNKPDILKLLIENKADVNHQDKSGFTAIHHAVDNGYTDLIKYLAELGKADLNLKCINRMLTPCMIAAYKNEPSILQALIQHKADLNCYDKGGHAAIHIAAIRGNIQIIKCLIEDGKVDINLPANDKLGSIPLVLALNSQKINKLNYLQQLVEHKANINYEDKLKCTVISYARKKYNSSIAKYFEDLTTSSPKPQKNSEYSANELLVQYSISGDLERIKKLIESKADVNFFDSQGLAAIHHATMQGNVEIIRYLIETCHVDVNQVTKNKDDYTPCMLAAYYDKIDILKQLVEYKANIKYRNNNNIRTISLALSKCNLETILYLKNIYNESKIEKQQVIIWWDYENVPAPKEIELSTVVQGIKTKAREYGDQITIYLFSSKYSNSIKTKEMFIDNDIEIVPVIRKNREEKQVADNAIKFAINPKIRNPGDICILIATDAGYAEQVKNLALNGHKVILIYNPAGCNIRRKFFDYQYCTEFISFYALFKNRFQYLDYNNKICYYFNNNVCEKDKCKNLNVCFICGSKDHGAIKCNENPQTAPLCDQFSEGDCKLDICNWTHICPVCSTTGENKCSCDKNKKEIKQNELLLQIEGVMQTKLYKMEKTDKAKDPTHLHSAEYFNAANKLLIKYSSIGDLPKVKLLVGSIKANVNSFDKFGQAPIHLAVYKGHMDIVRFLIKQNNMTINQETRDPWARTPCMLRSNNGFDFLKQLVEEFKADVNYFNVHGLALIHYAVLMSNTKMIHYLIETCKVDINLVTKNKYGNTPCIIAAENNKLYILECLVEYKADVNFKNKFNLTALDIARAKGHLQVVEYLQPGFLENEKQKNEEQSHPIKSQVSVSGANPFVKEKESAEEKQILLSDSKVSAVISHAAFSKENHSAEEKNLAQDKRTVSADPKVNDDSSQLKNISQSNSLFTLFNQPAYLLLTQAGNFIKDKLPTITECRCFKKRKA